MLALPLTSERLVLRDFRADDLDAVLAYASDPEVMRFMFYERRDRADAEAYLARMLASQRESPRRIYELAVERRRDGRVIGAGDLTLAGESEADLGYILARHAWGAGYATELALALVDAGFAGLGLTRIFSVCAAGHRASARVLEKAGLRHEAHVPGYVHARGRSWDVERYALMRVEWEARCS